MTAQQQLAELNAVCSRLWSQRHSESEAAAFYNKAGTFIRDHGPAFDALLAAYTARKSAIESLQTSEYNSGERLAAIKAYDAADDAIFAALRKLTQDA